MMVLATELVDSESEMASESLEITLRTTRVDCHVDADAVRSGLRARAPMNELDGWCVNVAESENAGSDGAISSCGRAVTRSQRDLDVEVGVNSEACFGLLAYQ